MKAVTFIRSATRQYLIRTLGSRLPFLKSGLFSCVKYIEQAPLPLPTEHWVRIRPILSGICGSDLAMLACRNSAYFNPFLASPFVPGHEVVGRIEEIGPETSPQWQVGQRVIIEPVLGCEARGIDPLCYFCSKGHYANCIKLQEGSIKGGIQIGACAATGGGWSTSFVAHPSQLHLVPDNLSDEEAVLAEPYACALHAALKLSTNETTRFLVQGCGTIGLLLIAGYRALGGKGKVYAAARYRHQGEMAKKLGADEVFTGQDPEKLYKWSLVQFKGSLYRNGSGKPTMLGGVSTLCNCVGSADSIDDAIRLTAAGGKVFLVGMPSVPKDVDWTGIWHKELSIQGVYAYGREEILKNTVSGEWKKTMAHGIELMQYGLAGPIKDLVNRRYPLHQYGRALNEAFNAGHNGAFKVVFRFEAPQKR